MIAIHLLTQVINWQYGCDGINLPSNTPKKANNNLLSLPNSNMSVNSNKRTTPQAKARLFAMGGFSENKLNFNDDGKLSDDGESYDLDELS